MSMSERRWAEQVIAANRAAAIAKCSPVVVSEADRSIEDIRLGDAFRASLLDRADGAVSGCPFWHGWAVMNAFLAGLDAGRAGRDAAIAEATDGRLCRGVEHMQDFCSCADIREFVAGRLDVGTQSPTSASTPTEINASPALLSADVAAPADDSDGRRGDGPPHSIAD